MTATWYDKVGSTTVATERSNTNIWDIDNFILNYTVINYDIYPTSGLLNYVYKPLKNLRNDDGALINMTTDKLNFDLTNPVNIEAQSSYDGSVNLILNDDRNKPRLINSRFTVLENNRFEIMDRSGNNDTNIYDENSFENSVSLYKQTLEIPSINFLGVEENGKLPVGNYVFYFKYIDSDGNETDFIEESSIISCFLGKEKDPFSINGGMQNQDSGKSILFNLLNCDTNYDYISVYYTRSTSTTTSEELTNAYKINKKFIILNNFCNILINGYESISEIPLSDINLLYNVVDKAKCQTQIQNRLFLANTSEPDIDYKELTDLSLYFVPTYDYSKELGNISFEYKDTSDDYAYYNSKNIYNYTGYWNHEIYRIGIVYLLKNNTLSPVFNIRGINNINDNTTFTQYHLYNGNDRQYIQLNESTNLLGTNTNNLENDKGVIRFDIKGANENQVLGLNITLKVDSNELDLFNTLIKKYCNGFFFVRQKRIPTILAQAMVIGLDNISNLPCTKIQTEEATPNKTWFIESFIDNNCLLNNNFSEHIHWINDNQILNKAALCPEYELNQFYYNKYFTGNKLVVKYSDFQPNNINVGYNSRFFGISDYTILNDKSNQEIKIIGVADDSPVMLIDNQKYKARAGEREEAWRNLLAGTEVNPASSFSEPLGNSKKSNINSYVRGSFGSYLGLDEYNGNSYKLLDIYIPNYKESSMRNYFKTRFNDSSPYYAISERFNINKISNFDKVFYRGDCYICNFTHRMHRNFQDIETPVNNIIIDNKTFATNYVFSKEDSTKYNDINRSDVNAVEIGTWLTFKVRSSMNLSLRSLDLSYPAEESINGHPRCFYPLYSISTSSAYNVPESNVINKAYSSTLSDKYHIIKPTVPYIKNYFHTRISYSNIAITDAFKNGYRIFNGTDYQDYPTVYGGITKIFEWFGSMICIFEHAVALIPINERTVAANSVGGSVYINTENVLPNNPKILSGIFGSQWSDSVIKTQNFIYGVDTVSKKIWRTNGQSFEVISDFVIQKFLNDNITLTETEITSIIGIRNVKTHYNASKHDVMFTFYDTVGVIEEKCWNICYNELLQKWITFYSWLPIESANIYNTMFTIDRQTSKNLALYWMSNSNYETKVIPRVTLSYNNNTWIINDNLSDYNGTYYKLGRDPYGNYNNYIINNKILSATNHTNGNKLAIEIYDNTNTLITTCPVIVYNNTGPNIELGIYKHGYSGLFKSNDIIKPCYWYEKQHPFEFEIIVNQNPFAHKIFEYFQILANKVEPESLHFELIGDAYDFKSDAQNEFFRQQAWKDILSYNGKDILCNRNYEHIIPQQEKNISYNKKSITFPLYYFDIQKYDDLYHSYQLKTDNPSYNYANLSGTEIRYDNKFFYYDTHCLAKNIESVGRLRGNMQYLNDKWSIQIPSIKFLEKNEMDWEYPILYTKLLNIPYTSHNNPGDLSYLSVDNMPPFLINKYTNNNNLIGFNMSDDWGLSNKLNECKQRDKVMKIKIRYTGNKLTNISLLRTIFNIIG